MKTMTLKNQAGRSMFELLGVMALAGVMLVGAVRLYQTVRTRQARITGEMNLSDLAKNSKLLYTGRGDYAGISLDYLIKAGAVRSLNHPYNAKEYFIRSENLGKEFSINLTGISFGDCTFVATTKMEWADHVRVNGNVEDAKSYCFKTGDNEISIFVK